MATYHNNDVIDTLYDKIRQYARDASYQSWEGLYPIGEGAGYAGGIMSSAIDGIMCAEQILKNGKELS